MKKRLKNICKELGLKPMSKEEKNEWKEIYQNRLKRIEDKTKMNKLKNCLCGFPLEYNNLFEEMFYCGKCGQIYLCKD